MSRLLRTAHNFTRSLPSALISPRNTCRSQSRTMSSEISLEYEQDRQSELKENMESVLDEIKAASDSDSKSVRPSRLRYRG
jgi:hypothetical protein